MALTQTQRALAQAVCTHLDCGRMDGIMVPLRQLTEEGALPVLRFLLLPGHLPGKLLPVFHSPEAMWVLLRLFQRLGSTCALQEATEFSSVFRATCFPVLHCTAAGLLETLDLLCSQHTGLIQAQPGSLAAGNLLLPPKLTLLHCLVRSSDLRCLLFWHQRIPTLLEELAPHLPLFALRMVERGRADWLDYLLHHALASIAGQDLYQAVLDHRPGGAWLTMLTSLLLHAVPVRDYDQVLAAVCRDRSTPVVVFQLLLAHPLFGIHFRDRVLRLLGRPPALDFLVQQGLGSQRVSAMRSATYFLLNSAVVLADPGVLEVPVVVQCLRDLRRAGLFSWGLRQSGAQGRTLVQCLIDSGQFWPILEGTGVPNAEILPQLGQHIRSAEDMRRLFGGRHSQHYDSGILQNDTVVIQGRAMPLEKLAVFVGDRDLLLRVTSHPLFNFPHYLGPKVAVLHWVVDNRRKLDPATQAAFLDAFCHPLLRSLWTVSAKDGVGILEHARAAGCLDLVQELQRRASSQEAFEVPDFDPESLLVVSVS